MSGARGVGSGGAVGSLLVANESMSYVTLSDVLGSSSVMYVYKSEQVDIITITMTFPYKRSSTASSTAELIHANRTLYC